jgi:hypothetical protein
MLVHYYRCMRHLLLIVAACTLFGSALPGQTTADTLAIFDAAAKKIGMSSPDLATSWRVKSGDSLTLRLAAHRNQPTGPVPAGTVYCRGSATDGDFSGHITSAKLTFTGAKAQFSLLYFCTMRRRGETWPFMQGDVVALELRDGVWVATEHFTIIS